MTFARRVFLAAAIYGIVVLLPQYLMEGELGRGLMAPLTHPEHFYGFVGVALTWQLAFLFIANDPVRYRALMPVAALEKLSFGLPVIVLYLQRRVDSLVLGLGLLDLLLATLFALAFRATRAAALAPGGAAR